MPDPTSVEINLQEKFGHLSRAPITEAVIEVRARVEVPWNEQEIAPQYIQKLPDYPERSSERGMEQRLDFRPGLGVVADVKQGFDFYWNGLRFRAADKPQIVQLFRDLFSFTRLSPYENWEAFSEEAIRLLAIHQEVARPSMVQRLGVRFINRIEISPGIRFEDYFTAPPREMSGLRLPFAGFFHNDTLAVSGHSYLINLIRTMQVPQDTLRERPALFLDIDVFTLEPFALELRLLEQHLKNMRWLKNKIFFGNLTESALQKYQ
jgi:uncharacterized protein (TIGR04255 family)